LRRWQSTSGVGKQPTHLAKQNCAVPKVQRQRYTALEQHDSMQYAHMSCTRVQGNITLGSDQQTSLAIAFRVPLFTAFTGLKLCEAHLAFVWMKSNGQLLVLAFDGQGIYTSLHLHQQHAVDAK